MDTDALEIVWNGRDGWVAGEPSRRGELLPGYESRTTLTDAIKDAPGGSDNPMLRVRSRRRLDAGRSRKYPQATCEAICASRRDGLTLRAIADAFDVPLRTVLNIITMERRE